MSNEDDNNAALAPFYGQVYARSDVPTTEAMLRQQVEHLSQVILLLGRQLPEITQSRDRVLAENCRMTEINRALASVARASLRFRKALKDHEQAEILTCEEPMPDAVVQEIAEADADLEALLEEHQNLFVR